MNLKHRLKGRLSYLGVIGPGLAVAATGVGAGDLAGSAFAGSKLGVAVLWAVLLGAFFKFLLTQGFAKWQLATGTTIVEGAIRYLGRPFQVLFLGYLFIWSFMVGSALISACGVAFHALLPLNLSTEAGKIVFGILHSLLALLLVWFGKYRIFEKVMSLAVGVMVVTVLLTAALLGPNLSGVLSGLFVPSIPAYTTPDGGDQGFAWTLALLGGVGGTMTILCYGYWIREKSWEGMGFLGTTRIDLATAYCLTALFGIAMVVIASEIDLEGGNSSLLIVTLARQLEGEIGSFGRSIFLLGAWAAMFTSLLGVWQSVPYLYADFHSQLKAISSRSVGREPRQKVDTDGTPYRAFLIGLAVVPILGIFHQFVTIQKIYAIFGSLVIPFFAAILLLLNGNGKRIGQAQKNSMLANGLLLLVLLLYLGIGAPALLNTVSAFLE